LLQFITYQTTKALKDPKFYDISREDLIKLLKRDDLSIDSEVELYEAVTRWGLKQVTKDGKTATPELIRQKLGPEIIKSIRFLTMTNAEFSRININARILDFVEGLSVFLYMNSPENAEMPSTMSPITKKREPSKLKTFQSVGPPECDKGTIDNDVDYYDYFTSTRLPNTNSWNLAGIQIPRSFEGKRNCSLKEHFDVIIMKPDNQVVKKYTYNEVPPCDTERFFYHKHSGYVSYTDKEVVSIKFDSRITIPGSNDESRRYKLKVVFHGEPREYPMWVAASNLDSSRKDYFTYGTSNFMGEYGFHYNSLYGEGSFVYSWIIR
jgi:hypothetical protein